MTCNYPNLDRVNINVFTKFGQVLPIILRILSRKEILTSIMGSNFVDRVNFNVYTKFSQILSIRSQDIVRKQNSDINKGPYLCYEFTKKDP